MLEDTVLCERLLCSCTSVFVILSWDGFKRSMRNAIANQHNELKAFGFFFFFLFVCVYMGIYARAFPLSGMLFLRNGMLCLVVPTSARRADAEKHTALL